jgi:hypothetical protein
LPNGHDPLYPERPLPRYTAFHLAAEEGIIPFYEKQRGHPLQVLELSGGGQNGAFGAGFLKGWRERGGWRHAEHRLPWCQEGVGGEQRTGAHAATMSNSGRPRAAIPEQVAVDFDGRRGDRWRGNATNVRGHCACA